MPDGKEVEEVEKVEEEEREGEGEEGGRGEGVGRPAFTTSAGEGDEEADEGIVEICGAAMIPGRDIDVRGREGGREGGWKK